MVDVATRTSLIEITLGNADRHLRPGMFAKVRLIVGIEKNVPLVRKEAVLGRGNYAYVYAVENGAARKKNVRVGHRQGEYYGINEGVADGDVVIVMGQQKLRDGAAVKVEMDEPAGTAGKDGEGEK